jgi:pimeloyl-ACP methyl ester carboxylesterase
VQFPIDAYEQFMKQGVPRWVTTDDAIVAAYLELIDKVCPGVLLVHSQAGAFAFRAAEARPDKIKAMVIVEPSGTGDKDRVAALKNIPIAVINGDNAKDHPRWGKIRQNVVNYTQAIKGAGGSVEVIDLPDIGIRGNTHMVMMDKNSDQVAAVIQKWLAGKGLVD